MKYFAMIGEMNTAMEEKFIEFANQNKDDAWSIVLNTPGGGFFPTEMIVRIINAHSECEIVVQGAYSSGFVLLTEVKCKIVLSKTARGMLHYGKWDLTYSDKQTPYYHEDDCIIKNMPFHKRNSESRAKKVMTKNEYKKFKADQDIYFDFKRMKEIFPDAEIMK